MSLVETPTAAPAQPFSATEPGAEFVPPAARAGFLPALTGLRFFAALHVVGHHLRSSQLLDLQAWPEVDRFFQRAGASVGLFFILSGFILAYGNLHRLRSKPFAAGAFFGDRFARIYPVYALGLFLTLPLFLAERSFLGGGITSSETMLFGGLVLTLTQAWLPQAALAWNVPGWSLSVEFFFYLTFPFALGAIRNWSRRTTSIAIALCGLTASGVAFYVALNPIAVRAATGLTTDQVAAVMKYDPLVRLPEFFFGMLLGRLFFLRSSTSPVSTTSAAQVASRSGRRAAILAALFVGILACCPNGIFDLPIHNGLLAPLIGMLLWQLALGGAGLPRLLSLPIVVALGQASYALYIVHTPVIQFARILCGGRHNTVFTSPPVALGATIVSILAALVVRSYFEEPLRKRITARFAAPRPALAAAPTNSSAVAVGAR